MTLTADGLQKKLAPLARPEIERGNDLLIQAMRQCQDERPTRPDKMIPLVFRYVERLEDQISILTDALRDSDPQFKKAHDKALLARTGGVALSA